MSAGPSAPSTNLEPGDRFEVFPADGRIPLPDYLRQAGPPVARLTDLAGRPHVLADPAGPWLGLPGPLPELGFGDTLWLEYQGGDSFRLVLERSALSTRTPEVEAQEGLSIEGDGYDP